MPRINLAESSSVRISKGEMCAGGRIPHMDCAISREDAISVPTLAHFQATECQIAGGYGASVP